jgi:diguanylate cyclase (GGDEF)-like protein/PAS domain S-box-containing protein
MADEGAFLREILDNLDVGVYFVDRERRITYWNRAAENITGYASEDVLGKRCADNLLVHVDEHGTRLCLAGCPLEATMREGDRREAHVFLHHREGHRVAVSVRAHPMRDPEGAIVGAVETFSETLSQADLLGRLEELRRLSLHDHLTGLANRRFAEATLASRLEEWRRYEIPFGVLFIDIDHFKRVNDDFGHDTGDEVLRMVARSMLNASRSFDVVARWGGEEFVAVVPNTSEEQLFAVANRHRHLVGNSRLQSDRRDVAVTVSIGATVVREGDTAEEVIRRADQLLLQSKSSGRNTITLG